MLSESEAIMLARRIQVAKMLLEGKKYEEITKELHVGPDTVGRVQQWLTAGFGGYKKAVEAFKRVLEQRVRKKETRIPKPYSFEWVKKKYPMYFLLSNLMDQIDKKSKNK